MSFSIRFESERSIEEKRQIRQSEWERVRKPEDPLQAPEAPICNKSLFEQLQVKLFTYQLLNKKSSHGFAIQKSMYFRVKMESSLRISELLRN